MNTSIRPLVPDSLDDFRRLLSLEPFGGWCWCVAWEVGTWDGWGERTAEENRALREERWAAGEFHGYLLDLGEPAERTAIAWCRVGPRRTWPKLVEQFGLDPDQDVHAFTCFGIDPAHRGRGHVHRLMALALDDLAARGVTRVEGFPRRAESADAPGEVWNGPRALYERAGFVEIEGAGTERSAHMTRGL